VDATAANEPIARSSSQDSLAAVAACHGSILACSLAGLSLPSVLALRTAVTHPQHGIGHLDRQVSLALTLALGFAFSPPPRSFAFYFFEWYQIALYALRYAVSSVYIYNYLWRQIF
jgi:hypothetical protein